MERKEDHAERVSNMCKFCRFIRFDHDHGAYPCAMQNKITHNGYSYNKGNNYMG